MLRTGTRMTVAGLLLLGVGTTLTLAQGGAPTIPGYRLESIWSPTIHGLTTPSGIATGADGTIWLLDGKAAAVVILAPDGTLQGRRPVAPDALDLAPDPAGDLFLGRLNPYPGGVGRYDPTGKVRWSRKTAAGSGSGAALTAGRLWLTEPGARALTWFGTVDGGASGQLADRNASDGFPSDVSAAPDGTLFATDAVGRAVLAWAPPYLPGDAQRTDLLESNGPYRVGAGADEAGRPLAAVLLADGTVRVQRPDGTLLARFTVPGQPADLAVGSGARIYVLDDDSGEIRVYVPGRPPTATPAPPDPPLTGASCRMVGGKTLAPAAVERCGTTQVTLRLDAQCPPEAVVGADVAVIMDHSLSMDQGARPKRIDFARDAARHFVGGLDFRFHQAAVITFSDEATVAQPLTTDRAAVLAALDPFQPRSGTHIEAAIRLAMDHLTRHGRPNALPLLVLLTDGAPTLPAAPEANVAALVAAERARSRRAYVVTIGLGTTIDSRLMAAIASSPDDFYYAPDPGDLDKIYDTILRVIGRLGVTDLTIEDTPRTGFTAYVDGSGQPPPLRVHDSLTWNRPALPPGGLAFTYTLQAVGAPGLGPSGAAQVRYTDADGTRRTWQLPEPDLALSLPPATPGGTLATPAATPPPSPAPPVVPASCPAADGWRVAVRVFPDTVGYGGYPCPGCNGIWDSGDHWLANGGPPGPVVVAIEDGGGRVLWRDTVTSTGPGPLRALVPLCEPPPYVVRLEQVPAGYTACPNSPLAQTVAPVPGSRFTQASFGLWSACAPLVARPTVPAATPLPACPQPGGEP